MNVSLPATVARYRELLEKGDNLLLIDQLYAEDIQQVENDEAPVIGKPVIRAMEKNNLNGVNSLEQKIVSLLIDEATGIVMGEMEIFFDSKKYGPKKTARGICATLEE